MKTVVFDTRLINDNASFHATCSKLFCFFDGYGKNMDAFIDCMSSIGLDDGISSLPFLRDENLMIVVEDYEAFNARCPEIAKAFFECLSFVNRRFEQVNEKTRIALVLT